MTAGKQAWTPRPATAASYDWPLLTIVMALLLLGLVMVFSASYPLALEGGNAYHYVWRQLLWTAIGLAGLITAARIPYTFWERWSVPLMGGMLLVLLAVLIVGDDMWGARRTLAGGSIQPSEPAKIIVLIYISTWLASKGDRIQNINYGLIPFGILLGIVASLVVAQPDISTTLLIVLSSLIVFFIAGAELKQLLGGVAVAALTFGLVITRNEYAKQRISSYIQSADNPLNSSNWQISQAAQALVHGGPLGLGLGKSNEKLPGSLPLSWTDNIFAIIGEELGLLGTLVVVLLFAFLAYRGIRIALKAPDNFGMLLATGITCLLVLQALVNMAVTVAIAPPTGLPLPFISFGGSSLVTTLGAIGILLSISRYSSSSIAQPGRLSNARFDLRWWDRRSRVSRSRHSSTARTSSTTRRTSARRKGAGRPGSRNRERH
jgi:cell division protein FtsW